MQQCWPPMRLGTKGSIVSIFISLALPSPPDIVGALRRSTKYEVSRASLTGATKMVARVKLAAAEPDNPEYAIKPEEQDAIQKQLSRMKQNTAPGLKITSGR